MPSRVIPFVNNEYYHIFNRGVAKMNIFSNTGNFKRFLNIMQYYQLDEPKPRYSFFDSKKHTIDSNKKIVNIICYCLMPNHFHLLVQQVRNNGITEFISKISNSYTKYYNIKNKRIGPLFQGEFKAVHISDENQLVHLSRYIHLNPLVGYVTKDINNYKWSSYHEYITKDSFQLCSKEIILNHFKSPKTYKQFLLDHSDYAKKLERIKHQLLDYP